MQTGRLAGKCDVYDHTRIRAVIERVVEQFGTVDILVNNAHDTRPEVIAAPFEQLSVDQMRRHFDCGPIAAVVAMQACFPYLGRQGGRVINMASAAGVVGLAGLAPYAMAKEALRAATRVAAREWGQHGITVNTICPAADTPGAMRSFQSGILGDVAVALPPIPRLGSPEDDVAPVVLFLASSESRYVTGYTYMVDGGGCCDAARQATGFATPTAPLSYRPDID